jgi:hypothetical protein
MARWQGTHTKLERALEKLEGELGMGSVAEAMRNLALYGELPSNPHLKREVECMVDMSRAMANTIPKWVPPEPAPEAKEERLLSETFAQETEVAGTPDNSIKAVRIGPGEYVKVH